MTAADDTESAVGNPWLGISAGTAIAAAGFWLGLLFVESATVVGLTFLALGAILSMLALAGFGGAADPFKVGIRAAVLGLGAGSFFFVLLGITGNGTVSLLIPMVVLGIGGTAALPPIGDPRRLPPRLVATTTAAIIVVALGGIAPPLWAFLAPLVPLPAVGGGDWIMERSRE